MTLDDNEDINLGSDAETETAPSTSLTGREALVTAMLKGLDTASVRRALAHATPQLVLIETVSAQWANGLSTVINRRYERAYAFAVTELKKDGNAAYAKDLLEHLSRHRHLVVCTHDAASMLPTRFLGAADVRLVVPGPELTTIRQAIRLFAGRSPRGLTDADFAGLDFEDIALALRDGSSSASCVTRLRRAKAPPRTAYGPTARVKTIEQLPLSQPVATWASDLLGQIRDVDRGIMAPSDLPYTLLHGPAGTGKSTIAAAVAQSAGWRFVSTSVGDWFSSSDGNLGGVSKACAQFIDDLLAEPHTIGFIDEIDGIPDRKKLRAKDREWWVPIVTLVLLQIDRIRRSGKPALLLAATNYPDRLDASLTRMGRIGLHVAVLPPGNEKEVMDILRFYLKDALPQSTLEAAARLGLGAPAATIEGWVQMAQTTARMAGRDLISADLLGAVAPLDGRGASELQATALHEAGHAVVAYHLGIGIKSASILSRQASGGNVLLRVISHYPDRDELERTATAFLGGRAADMALGKGPNAGAQLDLEMATQLLARGVGEFGLYDTLAYRAAGTKQMALFAQVDVVLHRLLESAIGIVKERQEQVRMLAGLLLQHRVLDEASIIDALSKTAGSATDPQRSKNLLKNSSNSPLGPMPAKGHQK